MTGQPWEFSSADCGQVHCSMPAGHSPQWRALTSFKIRKLVAKKKWCKLIELDEINKFHGSLYINILIMTNHEINDSKPMAQNSTI